MNLVNQSAFLKALGWSLLDSLWQLGVLWLVYVCLTANGKRYQSRQRHTLALISLAAGSVWFLITLVINFYQAAVSPASVTLLAGSESAAAAQLSPIARLAGWFEPALPFLSVGYLLAGCFLFFRFYRQYRYTQRLFTQGLQKAHPEWRVFLQQAVAHMGIRKKVTIWFSSLVDTPLTLGFLKPVILLPVAAVNHLTIKQAEAIILHELNHIRRNDYLVNLLIACVDIILFFNPFARVLTNIIRKERENSCDDMVLQFRYDAHTYVKALLTLEQNRLSVNPALAVAATGKDSQLLLNRVKRMLTDEPVITAVNQKLIAYLLSALLIGFIGLYNPGKIIIKQIDEIVVRPVTSTETPQSFSTPAAGETEKPLVADLPKIRLSTTAPEKSDKKELQIEELEDLIELTADAKLAGLTDKIGEIPEQLASFASNGSYEFSDYTLAKPTITTAPAAVLEAYPYVPTSSFSYQVVEDTTLPKKYILTFQEQKAKETIDKALVALQAVDWKKLEKELKATGKEIDISQLKAELKKAVADIDWKKLSEQAQTVVNNEITDELKDQQESFRIQLGNYQRDRVVHQQQLKEAQNKVLIDRLEQHQKLKRIEGEKNNCNCPSAKKVKKIVII